MAESSAPTRAQRRLPLRRRGGEDTRARTRGRATAAALLVALVAFLTSWAFASPIGATPDENYHMVSIWCIQGDRESACRVSEDGTMWAIPAELPVAICYAFDPEESAACAESGLVADDTSFVTTRLGDFGDHAGDYPPLFYTTMSAFVGPDIARSILTMRLVNVAIFTLLVSVVYAASTARVRRAIVATTAVTIIPVGAFLIPSINPSGWTITSAFTLFFAVHGYVRTTNRTRMLVLGAASVVALALGAGSRADGSIYAALGVVAATVLAVRTFRPSTALLLRLVLPVVLVIAAGMTFLSVGRAAVSGPTEESAGAWQSVLIFFDVFEYFPGSLGMQALGWGDTTMPSIVWFLVGLACAGVVVVSIAPIGRRRGLVLLVVAGSLVFIPTYIAATSWTAGAALQSRYIYPLVILVVAVATLVVERRETSVTPAQRWLIVAAVSVANAVAIYTNLRRYVTGIDVERFRLAPGEWWWEDAIVSPEAVCVIAAVAMGVALTLATRVLVAPDAPPASDAVDGARDGGARDRTLAAPGDVLEPPADDEDGPRSRPLRTPSLS